MISTSDESKFLVLAESGNFKPCRHNPGGYTAKVCRLGGVYVWEASVGSMI